MNHGSNITFRLPGSDERHDTLVNRNLPLQHILQSVYDGETGKDLKVILQELQYNDRTFKYQLFENLNDDQTIIDITNFSFNVVRDELYVNVAGADCFEGPDNQYIKLSPTQIQFNFPLKKEYTIVVALMGTKSNESFGDDIYTALNKFTQLTDTPSSYHGKMGRVVTVNERESGLEFKNVKATHELQLVEYIFETETSIEQWIQFAHSGLIKGIKVLAEDHTEHFNVSLWTKPNGGWIYYSGDVFNVLWDIMEIPFVDESGQDSVYLKIENKGPKSIFLIQFYILL